MSKRNEYVERQVGGIGWSEATPGFAVQDFTSLNPGYACC
jgi:hypothetical protein